MPGMDSHNNYKKDFKRFDSDQYNNAIASVPFHVANTFEDTDDGWAWEKLLTDVLDYHARLVEKKSTKPRPPQLS